ncbi:hypothetical protein [Mycobacterium sp. OAE908]|uniref:hypothetical protein n=1 Tax=Mycobacterium sp. OAE908 TaxID=2817899 RepID=UPI001AE692E3
MNSKRIAAASAIMLGGLAGSLTLGSATAGAAPAGPSSAVETIARLQAQGSQVIVNKVGSGPISQCTVESVRPVQTRQAPTGNPLTGVPNMQTTTTVHVGLKC